MIQWSYFYMNVQAGGDDYKVALNDAVPFMGASVSTGSAIARHPTAPLHSPVAPQSDSNMKANNSHVSSANTIVLTPGTYVVSYYFQGDTTNSDKVLTCGLRLIPPGLQAAATAATPSFPATLAGSRAQSVGSSSAAGQVSNTMTITITEANTWLQLVNISPATVEHGTKGTDVTGQTWASLNIQKVG